MSWEGNQLNEHLQDRDDAEAREQAVETLAESLIRNAMRSARDTLIPTDYNLWMSDIVNATSHDEAFNELYYAIAERLIKAHEKGQK